MGCSSPKAADGTEEDAKALVADRSISQHEEATTQATHFDAVLPSSSMETKQMEDLHSITAADAEVEVELQTKKVGAACTAQSMEKKVAAPAGAKLHCASPTSPTSPASPWSPPVKQRTMGELQELSQDSKTRLQNAFADGRLTVALRRGADLSPDLEQAKASDIVPDLAHAKSEAFRKWAREKLLESHSEGRLETVSALLAKLAVPKATSQANASTTQMLVATDGTHIPRDRAPSSPMAHFTQAGPREITTAEGRRTLPQHGRQRLAKAYIDGRLKAAARAQALFVPDTAEAKAEEFRRQARQTLLASQSDGRLEMLIFALSWTYSDTEPCRAMLGKGRLEQASNLNGALKTKLHSAMKKKGPLVSWYLPPH